MKLWDKMTIIGNGKCSMIVDRNDVRKFIFKFQFNFVVINFELKFIFCDI